MSRVRIVFDRLRSEEKMLQREASGLGHDAEMIDAKITQINTDSKREDFDFGDVVLERCVSYFRGLHLTSALEFMGVPVVNSFAVASNCGNKMFMSLLLKKGGVPTPKTYFSFTAGAAKENLERVGYPLVIKPIIGSWGRGVVPLRDADAVDAMFEMREINDGPHDRVFYLQEVVERPPRDIRVITVGDRAVSAMYRKSEGGFTTNLASGAEPEPCEVTPELEDLAIRASMAVGGGILGVDMMEDRDRGLVVHEVNNTVEFKGLARVSKKNIPKEMVEYALAQVRK